MFFRIRRLGGWVSLVILGLLISTQPCMANRMKSGGKPLRNLKKTLKDVFSVGKVLDELNTIPPSPIQVFQYGPSKEQWHSDPSKYRFQWVCLMDRENGGKWYKRRAPRFWADTPPFHMRVIRPVPSGMLDYLMATKKIKVVKEDVEYTVINKKTGEEQKMVRHQRVLKRVDPKQAKKELEALREVIKTRAAENRVRKAATRQKVYELLSRKSLPRE